MKIFVTGAAGFVGRRLCSRLADDGHEVVAATRRVTRFDFAVENVAVGDLRASDFRPGLEGCDAVVHLAAHVHRMSDTREDRRAFNEVNVSATANLVRSCESAGVGRIVFLSTVKVHGETSGEQPFTESSPIVPSDSYSRSKAEAEELVRQSRVRSVILRPPLVYGPGVGANLLRLIRAVADRRLLPLGSIENRRSLVYVDNLVDAITRCVTADLDGDATFLVSDGEDVSSPELVRRIAAALGVRARLLSVPASLLLLGGAIFGRRQAVRRLVDSLCVDGSAIRRTLSWMPPHTLDEGLARTAAWFRGERGGR
jgi:nucleoside-diphosphate-sugar epimerase